MASKKKAGVEARAFAGFGESKLHSAPEGTFAPDNWDDYTVNGGAIPEHIRSVMTYAMTDQGKAEAEAAIEARGGRSSVEFLRDSEDKKIDEYGDNLADPRKGLVLQQDPLKVLMDRYLPAGHRGRWLGPKKCKEAGLVRGVVEYEPVLVDGKRVQMGDMFLASIPNDLAKEAEQHYAEIEKENRVSVSDKVQEYNDRNVGVDRLEGAARRRGKLDALVGEADDSARANAEFERDLNLATI